MVLFDRISTLVEQTVVFCTKQHGVLEAGFAAICPMVGWPTGIAPHGLPQIRTCGTPASGSSHQEGTNRYTE